MSRTPQQKPVQNKPSRRTTATNGHAFTGGDTARGVPRLTEFLRVEMTDPDLLDDTVYRWIYVKRLTVGGWGASTSGRQALSFATWRG